MWNVIYFCFPKYHYEMFLKWNVITKCLFTVLPQNLHLAALNLSPVCVVSCFIRYLKRVFCVKYPDNVLPKSLADVCSYEVHMKCPNMGFRHKESVNQVSNFLFEHQRVVNLISVDHSTHEIFFRNYVLTAISLLFTVQWSIQIKH